MRSKSGLRLYIKSQGQYTLLISIYVDDLIYTRNNTKMMMVFKEEMMKTFEMIDLGLMSYFLGIKVSKINEGTFILQNKYTKGLLKNFKMYSCKLVTTPV